MKFGSLGELIKYHREEKGLSQRELAKRVGTGCWNIYCYEKNRSKPRPKRLEDIKVKLGILDKEIEEVYPEYKWEVTSLGSLLRKKREGKGWSQRELAKRVGISDDSILRYEGCDHKPIFEIVEKLRKRENLDIPIKELKGVYEYDKECEMYKKENKSLGGLLRKKREEKGWNQRELAERVGCNRTMVGQYEKNKVIPRPKKLENIKIKLGILDKEIEKVYPEYKEFQKVDNLGSLIMKKREKKGWSQEELAEEIGTSCWNIYRYEKNRSKPRPKRLEDIKVKLGILDKEIEEVYPEYKEFKRVNSFGGLIRKKRREKGWTQEELAEEIGTSLSMISCYEMNKNKLLFRILENICEVLDISEKELEKADKNYYKQYLEYEKDKEKNLDDLINAAKEYLRR